MVTPLAIACLVMFAGVGLYIEKSPVYPPFAMAACWAVFLCFHACSRSLLFPIHEETLCFYVAGAAAFFMGGLVAHFFYRPLQITAQYDKARVKNVLSVLLLILAIGFPYYLRFVAGLVGDLASGSLWTSGGFWVVLREQLIEESTETLSGFSSMDNLVVLADIAVLIAWYHRDAEKWRAWAAFSFFLIYNLLTAGRSGFVSVLISLFTIEVVRRRRIPWRPIVVFGLVFVVAFFGLALLVGKAGANTSESFAENVPVLADGFELYAIGSLVAFDNMYQHPSAIPPTQNIDRNFKILASKVGIRTEVPYLHAEFTPVAASGLDTNAYTIYFSYFPQLGTFGSLVMMFMLGGGVTWAYWTAVGGGPRAVIMYALLFYGIPLSGYSENYFNNLNFLAKMLLVTFLCYGLPSSRRQPAVPC
jgi:oligosaccharide repeat unit polymerase